MGNLRERIANLSVKLASLWKCDGKLVIINKIISDCANWLKCKLQRVNLKDIHKLRLSYLLSLNLNVFEKFQIQNFLI